MSKSMSTDISARPSRRSVRFEYPLSILFTVTHDLLQVNLRHGDIVLVMDYSRNSDRVVAKRKDSIIDIPKKYIKRTECDDLKRYFAKLMENKDSSHSHQHHRVTKGGNNSLTMPLRYEVIGHKVVEYGDSFMTLFFILVTPYSADRERSSSMGNQTPFYYTKDGSWIVVKTQRCVDKLITKLEKYVGEGNLPSYRKTSEENDPSLHKPNDWDLNKWLTYRTQAMADFFIAFKNPKRGFYMGNSEHKKESTISQEYMHNPLLGNILGFISRPKPIVDDFTIQQKEEADDIQDLLENYNKNKYLKGKADSFMNNDAPLLMAIDSRTEKKTEHLIHGLLPMVHFLHTDKVTLNFSKPIGWKSASCTREGSNDMKKDRIDMSSPMMAMYPLLTAKVKSTVSYDQSLGEKPDVTHVEERAQDSVLEETDKIDEIVPHFELNDKEIIDAVQNEGVTVSPLTPINSLLRIWAISGLDRREDHKPEGMDAREWLNVNRWDIPEDNMMSAWEIDDANEGDDNSHEESASDDSYENSDESTGEEYDFDNIYSEGKDGAREYDGANEHKNSNRHDLFADRAARAAIMGIESDMLRKKLWKGFIDSSNYNVESDDAHGMISCGKHDNNSVQNSISTIKKSLDSIKDYLPERQEAHEGLESFSHFGLMIFSTAVTHRREIEDGADDDCSVGSLTPVAHGLQKSLSSVTNESGDENYEDVMTRLNRKIHTLFLDWEHRRETAKERLLKEKKKANRNQDDDSVSSTIVKSPTTSVFVAQVKNSCYKKKLAAGLSKDFPEGTSHSSYLPYPSQMRSLAPLTSSRLEDYITSRTKTLLSRKSERLLVIERMKGTEKAFHSKRVTSGQVKTLLEVIEGPDERQHAALLFIVRLTDVVETAELDSIFNQVEMTPECENRVKLVGSILSAEARAEDNLLAIHKLYSKCFAIGQKVKEVVRSSSKDDGDADYLRLKSIQKLKDSPLVSPKLQSGVRNKVKDFKSDISMMRQAVAEVHASLTTGFTVHLAKIRSEQDAIVKLGSELKLIVVQCESVCRMRGTLTAGRPEYLVFHRLKAALVCADKAKTIAGEVIDEATDLLTTMQKTLKRIEDYLKSIIKASTALLKQMSDSSVEGPSSISPAKVEKDLDNYLQDEQNFGHSEYLPVDHKSSIAMKTGLTAACAGAGWRRALQEVSIENFSKFRGLLKPQRDMVFDDMMSGDDIPVDDQSYMSDATYMCLLLSRIPILKDMRLVDNGNGRKSDSCPAAGDDDSKRNDEESMTYDDDFSYAGVYDETF